MSGSGYIKSRDSSIITWLIPSDMGFVRKTNNTKNHQHPQQQQERGYSNDTRMTCILKRVHSISTKSSLYHKNSPPPHSAPTHPQKQTNKQNLSCCLLYCNLYSDLEFSFYRLIHTTDFFEVPLKMFYAHKKGGCDCYLPKGTCLGALLLNTTMMGYVS